MQRFSYLLLPLFLSACSYFSDSEVIMRASPETRPTKPHMPPLEKPLEIPPDPTLPIPVAPQIGLKVPFNVD